MAGTVWEFFGYRSDDKSEAAKLAAKNELCPFSNKKCEKRLSDGVVSGVCSVKPATSEQVICCPIRLYADNYKILQDVVKIAFGHGLEIMPGKIALDSAKDNSQKVVAVFGKGFGGELRLPQKDGKGGYFVDWVLALLDESGDLEEFVAVEVQTIDTTGNYRSGRTALLTELRPIVKTSVGLNWENVSKRILPQLIYKGQVLQREELCRKGLFFVCPEQVHKRIMSRLDWSDGVAKYPLQPASITFLPYRHVNSELNIDGQMVELKSTGVHSTTVYKVQEAFNNVTLPEANMYKKAILVALDKY